MAKLGSEDYPADLDPQEAEKWMEVLVNEFGGVADSREAFAQAVGHKSTSSGTFRRKVADARKYGLMTPRGDFSATELGMQLANPKDKEDRMEARFEMLQNISLLKDIHDQLNGNVPPDEFWRVLTEISDASPKEAREAADWIQRLYDALLEAEQVMEETEESETETTTGETNQDQSTAQTAQPQTEIEPESAIYLRVGNDEVRFSELTDANIEIAKQVLDSKKTKVSDTQEEEEEQRGVQMRFS